MNIDSVFTYGNKTGAARIIDEEFTDNLLKYCSLVCIINNKKFNLANIFILTLKNTYLREVYKTMCDIDSDYEAVLKFLEYDTTLHKSKYIKKFLNNNRIKLK
jgi:hypothetical protein|tara:strand:- start:549 stop:857 length:309 start_codon:yes stop_codon:yes gene_type:complete